MRATFLAMAAAALVWSALGCAGADRRDEAMPVVVIRPGLRDRLALMDRYRLGDESRPRVTHTVEFVDQPADENGDPITPGADETESAASAR